MRLKKNKKKNKDKQYALKDYICIVFVLVLQVTYLEGRHLLQSLRRRNIEVIEKTIILEYLQK